MRLKFLTVIYNKPLDANVAVNSAQTSAGMFENFDIIVWDNSDNDFIRESNQEYANISNVSYLTENRNCSLSYIYNKVINNNNDDFDYIIISDDDTIYNENYFSEFLAYLDMDYLVHIPQIYINGKLKSPAKMGVVVGKHLDAIVPGLHYNLLAITSGVIINKKLLDIINPLFDENLNLYGIDTEFFIKLTKKQVPINVLDVKLEHDMSIYDDGIILSRQEKLNNFRYINNKKATIYVNFKRSLIHGLLVKVYYLIYERFKA